MKTAAIYARYSSNSQTEQSIEGQLDVCKRYAKDNDLQVVATYIDRAMTGTNDNRPDFQRMLKDSEKANWDAVLVYALDRFGRNSVEVAINKQKLKKTGKILVSATQRTSDNLDGTKNLDGIILENVYIGIAEYYSAELSQKVLRGLNENRKKGLFCGGGVPYGYRVENKRFYVDEQCAEIVRKIYVLYSLGATVPQIRNELNKQNVLFKGKPFNTGHIYKILSNERYSGKYTVHGETYTNTFPKIVDDEIFNRVAQIAKKNLRNKRSVEVVYLLKNKVKCGYCGRPVTADSGTSKHGKVIYYYKCSGRKRNLNDCSLNIIRKETLEKIVLDGIVNALSSPDVINKIVDHLYEIQTEMANEQKELKSLISEKQNIDLAIENILSAIERGVTSTNAIRRLSELEEKQLEYEKRITEEKSKTQEIVPKSEIAHFYKQGIQMEPIYLITYLVDEILLYNDKIEIRFVSPITKGPDESRDLLLYAKQTTIPFYDKFLGIFIKVLFGCKIYV